MRRMDGASCAGATWLALGRSAGRRRCGQAFGRRLLDGQRHEDGRRALGRDVGRRREETNRTGREVPVRTLCVLQAGPALIVDMREGGAVEDHSAHEEEHEQRERNASHRGVCCHAHDNAVNDIVSIRDGHGQGRVADDVGR